MKIHVILVFGFISMGLVTQAFSQIPPSRTLQVGDTIPEALWQHTLPALDTDGGKINIRLDEHKGKLIILDFWATWCTPCVALIPKMDTLQRRFEGHVQFLPVTYQGDREVAAFLGEYRKRFTGRATLPNIVGDTLIRHLFPHRTLPHYVWIGSDGVIKAITGYAEISADTIAEMLDKKNLLLAVKQDVLNNVPFDPTKPFLANGNGGTGESLIYQSALSRYVPGLRRGFSMSRPDALGIWQLSLTNSELYGIYRFAYGADSIFFGRNRLELNLNEPCRFLYDDNCGRHETWLVANAYTYQLFSAARDRTEMFSMLAEDLRRMLPMYQATIEKRAKTCWVLSRTDPMVVLTAVPGRPRQSGMGIVKGVGYSIQNSTLKGFLLDMNMFILQRSPYPLLDETGIEERIDLQIDAKLSDMEAINRSLESYGLQITLEERDIDVLVIRDAEPVEEGMQENH